MLTLAKCLFRGLLKLLYRVEVSGLENYYKAGNRVLIIANHTSLLDGILLYLWLPEKPTFAINTQIAQKKSFKPFLWFVDLFVMDPTSPLSVKSMIRFLKEDRKAVIFPEGRITITGSLMKIYDGPALVADRTNAMILPVSIDGAQFSPFSYMKGRGWIRRFPKIRIRILPPEKISVPVEVHGPERRRQVALQLQDMMFKLTYSAFNHRTTVFDALINAANRYGRKTKILEDIDRECISYQTLISRSVIFGQYIKRNTEQGERIGVLLPNTSGTVVTFMAIQYAGRIPAMLNYTVGSRALLQSCQLASIKTVYTSRKFIKTANLGKLIDSISKNINLLFLEDLVQEISFKDKIYGLASACFPGFHYLRSKDESEPDKAALVLFTSGSEGVPKGVVLSHSNLLSNYAQVSCHIDFNPRDILFSCLPLFHTFGLNAGCLMPLFGGSRIFLYPTPLHYRIIPELVYELGATILFGANTFFKGYARHAHTFDFYNVRYVVAGAEKLADDTQKLWMEKFGIRILQGYGVTETSPVISVNTPMQNKIGTVGRPVTCIDCYLEPVIGIEEGGELVVRGPNIMLGYLQPHSDKLKTPATRRGAGWYATGDIATIDDDGFITILGRAKRFAKIGGEMVSLTVVEELARNTWPEFNHAAINLPDEKKGEKIVLITDNGDATRKEIQEYARKHSIGELYIPKKVVLTESLPMLSTGKTDYKTLTEQAIVEDESGSGWLSRIGGLVKKHEQKDITTSPDDEQKINDES